MQVNFPQSFKTALIATALLSGMVSATMAADYPTKAVQLVVPYGSGPTDAMARMIGNCMAARFKQPIVVLNRPGANAQLGANLVKSAAPDGYNLLFAASSIVTDLVTTKVPTFDVRTDLEPITKIAFGIQGIYVNSNVPAKTIPEFIAYAKARPGKLNYGTTGIGSVNHVSTEAFSITTGIDMLHVPFPQGTGPILTAMMGGDLQFVSTDLTAAQPALDGGKIRILAVLAKERMPSRPNVPAIVEFYPTMAQYTGTLWFGFFAPIKTPQDILQKLHTEIVGCLNDREVRSSLNKYGYDDNQIIGNTPAQFKASIHEDISRLRDLVERAKMPLR